MINQFQQFNCLTDMSLFKSELVLFVSWNACLESIITLEAGFAFYINGLFWISIITFKQIKMI